MKSRTRSLDPDRVVIMDLGVEGRTRVHPLWPYLLLCGATAILVDLGSIHRGHHGDSLVPILVSLYRWTPFYWEQDRYGMLVPLLAMPFRHPLINLLVEEWLVITSGLSVFFLLARFLRSDASYPMAAALGASSFLALAPPSYQFVLLGGDQPYAVSMALGLGSLLLAEPGSTGWNGPRRLVGLTLMALAHWVNFGVVLLLGPLVLLRFLICDLPRVSWPVGIRWAPPPTRSDLAECLRRSLNSRIGCGLLFLLLGYEFGQILMDNAQYPLTSFAAVPRSDWPDSWKGLADNSWQALAPGAWPIALLVAHGLGILSLVNPRLRSPFLSAMGPAGVAAGAALISWLVVGTRVWVQINSYSFRYVVPSTILLQAAPAMILAVPLQSALSDRGRRWLGCALPMLLLLAALSRYGLPSIPGVRDDLDRTLGAHTADILASRCTHLAGSYFTVWPSVFLANLALADLGEDRIVWGITHRSQPTRVRWKTIPRDRLRVGIILGDPMGETWLRSSGFPPMVEFERRPTLRVMRPNPPASPAPIAIDRKSAGG